MAIGQNFLTGRMRKSAGGTRFSTWRGLNIIAAKPMEVRQNVTPAVQLNRDKMSLIGKMVSKLNPIVGSIYSLGISKTTPFADTVKFFRSRLLDTLKLDASQLSGASFGTGNVPSGNYLCVSPNLTSFEIECYNESTLFGTDTIEKTFVFVNDSCTKIGIITVNDIPNISQIIDLSTLGFVGGDKVAFAVKPVKFRPGADLSGKMKFSDSSSFYTIS